MTNEKYEKISAPYRDHPVRLGLLRFFNLMLTVVGYAAYPFLLYICYEAGKGDYKLLLTVILVPGASFVLLSLFRRLINARRPYEKLDIHPLIVKKKKGRSFPSRHVFCMFLIATCFCLISPVGGVLLMLAGVFMAWIRVVGGIHFPIDVIIGALVGLLCGGMTLVAVYYFC